MLTDADKLAIKARVVELQKLLAFHGLNSQVSIDAGDDDGFPQLSQFYTNGYWVSSTARCSPESWRPSGDDYRTDEEAPGPAAIREKEYQIQYEASQGEK